MSQRFVSGGAGNFTFDVANGLLDSVSRLEGREPQGRQGSRAASGRTIVAQLTDEVPAGEIEWEGKDGSGEPLKVWKWKALFVSKGSTSDPSAGRYVGGVNVSTGGIHHGSFGTAPSGYAVQLGGFAQKLDYVILHAVDVTGPIANERWFGFYGVSDPVAAGTFGLLRIINEQQVAERKWWYTVQPSRYRFPSGSSSPTVESLPGPPALAWNLYEPSLYGQPLSGPNGRLEVVGPIPIGSLVLGTLQTRSPSGQAFYVFQAPLPLRAECDGPGMLMMQQQGDARLMRDGI